MTDFPTVSRVSADLYARARKGLEKYGTTLERTDLTEREWLQHHYEELLDAACYVRVRRKSICVKVQAGVLMQKKPAQQFVPRNVVVKRMEPPPTPVAFGSLKKHPRPFSMLGGAR